MATGPVDLTPDPSTIQVKDLTPDPSTIKAKTPPSKSIKAVQAIAHGAPVAGAEPWVLKALQATGRASVSFGARGKMEPFESPAQTNADTDKMITAIPPLADIREIYGPGVARMVAGTVLDPATYGGASGGLKWLAGKLGSQVAPLLAKAGTRAPILEQVMDYASYGGKLKMDLAKLLHPEEAATWFAHARAAKSVAKRAGGTPKEQAAAAMADFMQRIKPKIDTMVKGVQAGKRPTKAEKPAVQALQQKVAGLNSAVEDFFSTTPRGVIQHAEDHPVGHLIFGSMRKAMDLPKQVLVGSSPLRHIQNIGALGAWHYPAAVPKAAIDTARALLSPDVYQSILKESAKQGLTSGEHAESSQFTQWLHKLPLMLRMGGGAGLGAYSAHQQGGNPLVGAAAGAVAGGVAPKWYDASTKILWTFDHVMKSTALRQTALGMIKRGMPEADAWARAAKDVGDRLVNYDESSGLIKDLRYFMPFATWQVKSVGSILRGLSEHPERALAVLRSYPAAAGDWQKTGDVEIIKTKPHVSKRGTFTPGTVKHEPLGATTSTPLAEFARRTADPHAWLRANLGAPWQAAAGALEHSQHPYYTYGKNPLQWLVQGELSAPGMPSPFGDSFVDQQVFGQTGIGQRPLPH